MNTPENKSEHSNIKSFSLATKFSALKQHKAGSTVKQICETYGCSKQSFCVWKKSQNHIFAQMKTSAKREEASKRSHLPPQKHKPGKVNSIRKSSRPSQPTKRFSQGEENTKEDCFVEQTAVTRFNHYTDASKSVPSVAAVNALYRNGFHVFPKLVCVTEAQVALLRKQNHTQVLFNDGCKKRLMYTCSPEILSSLPICEDVADFVNKINENCEPDMWASLLSLPFTMKQPAHFDFDPSKVVHLPDSHKPLLTVVALEDNTFLDVWVGYKQLLDGSLTTPLRSTRVCLHSGDVLVFVGDLIHAGSAYDEENIRLHCYFPLLRSSVPRPENQTHQVHRLKGEFSYLAQLVDEELPDTVLELRAKHGDSDF